MPTRGPQFPLVNEGHFQTRTTDADGVEHRTHTSQHGDYLIEHAYHDDGGGGHGVVRVKAVGQVGEPWGNNPRTHKRVASLKYDMETIPRATSNRPQPLTHTSYIDVSHEHRGRGLTGLMQGILQNAHPGAPNIASNELTEDGAGWRSHMAKSLRDPGGGQRIGYDREEGTDYVYRPATGQPRHALVRESGEWRAEDSPTRIAKSKK